MKPAKDIGPAGHKTWWTRRRVLCLGLIAAATLYVVLQPKLEQWTGWELPDLIQPSQPQADSDQPQFNGGASTTADVETESGRGFQLQSLGRDRYQSPAGLVYAPAGGEHRLDHVMRHAADIPEREVHGVFEAKQQADILSILDEAYRMVQAESPDVRKQGPDDKGRMEFTVVMTQRIGFVGGQAGAAQGHPATSRLKLVLDGNRVITAYPTWPARGSRR